jgi:hypothetical protein
VTLSKNLLDTLKLYVVVHSVDEHEREHYSVLSIFAFRAVSLMALVLFAFVFSLHNLTLA